MYGFLSAIFLHPPAGDLLRWLREHSLDFPAWLSGKAVRAVEELAASRNDIVSLRQEYMDLFAVPTGRYVSPFEDVYQDEGTGGARERGLLLGQQAIAVRRLYRQAGAEMARECRELPTHIGVELSFMAFLCEQEMEAISRGEATIAATEAHSETVAPGRYRALQRQFLQNHLNVWFPRLRQTIQAKARSPWYPALALITEEFLALDAVELVNHSLSPGDARPRAAAIASI